MKKRLLSLLICLMVAVSTISFVGCGGLSSGSLVLYENGMAYTVSEKGEALPVYSLSYEIHRSTLSSSDPVRPNNPPIALSAVGVFANIGGSKPKLILAIILLLYDRQSNISLDCCIYPTKPPIGKNILS